MMNLPWCWIQLMLIQSWSDQHDISSVYHLQCQLGMTMDPVVVWLVLVSYSDLFACSRPSLPALQRHLSFECWSWWSFWVACFLPTLLSKSGLNRSSLVRNFLPKKSVAGAVLVSRIWRGMIFQEEIANLSCCPIWQWVIWWTSYIFDTISLHELIKFTRNKLRTIVWNYLFRKSITRKQISQDIYCFWCYHLCHFNYFRPLWVGIHGYKKTYFQEMVPRSRYGLVAMALMAWLEGELALPIDILGMTSPSFPNPYLVLAPHVTSC